MLDQTFTAENFRDIYDLEVRKGINLDGRFFPDVESYTEQIRAQNVAIRHLRQHNDHLSKTDLASQLTALNRKKRTLKSEREVALDAALEQLGQTIRASGFRIQLQRKSGPKGKDVFPIVETACGILCGQTATEEPQ